MMRTIQKMMLMVLAGGLFFLPVTTPTAQAETNYCRASGFWYCPGRVGPNGNECWTVDMGGCASPYYDDLPGRHAPTLPSPRNYCAPYFWYCPGRVGPSGNECWTVDMGGCIR